MRFVTDSLGSVDTNLHLLVDDEKRLLWAFDAPLGAGVFIAKRFPAYKLVALLLTHGHYDHILGWRELEAMKPEVYAGLGDKTFFTTPEVMSSWLDPEERRALKAVAVNHWLRGGESLFVNGLRVEVRPSPGHSPGGLVFYLPDHDTAIVGDTIFRQSVGRTDLPGGSFADLEDSIRRHIFTLPPSTTLYPGHGPETTVDFERAHNPHVSP